MSVSSSFKTKNIKNRRREMFFRIKGLLVSALVLPLVAGSIIGCAGDTDGGEGADNAGIVDGDFVADGAAGASIEIDVLETIFVGGQSGFFVRLRDSAGQPIQFLRVVCDTEPGLGIVDPLTGAGLTDSFGNFSGRLAGVTRGSFAIECRGPFGTNLVAREVITIRGEGDSSGLPALGGQTLGLAGTTPTTGLATVGQPSLAGTSASSSVAAGSGALEIVSLSSASCATETTVSFTIDNQTASAVSVDSVTVSLGGTSEVLPVSTVVEAGGLESIVGTVGLGTTVSGSSVSVAVSGTGSAGLPFETEVGVATSASEDCI